MASACWLRCAGSGVMRTGLTGAGQVRRGHTRCSRGCGSAGLARWPRCARGRVRARCWTRRSIIWVKPPRCCRRACLSPGKPAILIDVRRCSIGWPDATMNFCGLRGSGWRCARVLRRARATARWPCWAGRGRARRGLILAPRGGCWAIRWPNGWRAIRPLCARTMSACRRQSLANWPMSCAGCMAAVRLMPNRPCGWAHRPTGRSCCATNRSLRAQKMP